MTEQCTCGCGIEITSSSPSQFFASYGCDRLWNHARQESKDAYWRAEQRFFAELIYVQPWPIPWEYPVTVLGSLYGEALSFVRNWAYWDIQTDDEETILRVMALRYTYYQHSYGSDEAEWVEDTIRNWPVRQAVTSWA